VGVSSREPAGRTDADGDVAVVVVGAVGGRCRDGRGGHRGDLGVCPGCGGLDHDRGRVAGAARGPATKATGGLRQGWPPAVLVQARGPPAPARWWPVSLPLPSNSSALVFVTLLKPAAAGAAPVADVPQPRPKSRSRWFARAHREESTMRSHGPRGQVGGPALSPVVARTMGCRGYQRLLVGTCIGSPHRVAPTISRGEPVRVERVAPCGQLPLPLQTSTVAGEVFAGLPEEVRQVTLVLLARLIARAALEVGDTADEAGLR
jgi:hypothetical protein